MIRIENAADVPQEDLDELFGSDEVADRCWCMWFITRVKDFRSAGREGNRAALLDLVAVEEQPVGLIAYRDGSPVGWCAVGPRSRYDRAVKTPTMRGHDPAENDTVWFVPCFFIRPTARRQGVAAALLRAAIAMATEHGAQAIEGFPQAGDRTRSRGSNFQTGVEPLFEQAGFEPVRRPSDNRVIMRRELGRPG
ncbi:MAG: GNAT family N-acetyltransferase [Acidimicrobiia bacterium]|nr:GNAT family N-acetyltransferase [Acidimicrobiia bacterium]